MDFHAFSLRNGKDFVDGILEQHRVNAEKFGLFNDQDMPTVLYVSKERIAYALHLVDGDFHMDNGLYDYMMKSARSLSIPVLTDLYS